MKCNKCGKDFEDNEKICKECKTDKKDEILKKEAKELTILSSILFFLMPMLVAIIEEFFLYDLNGIFLIISSIVLGVTVLAFVLIRYPKYKPSKILLFIYCIMSVFYIFLIVVGMITCIALIPAFFIGLSSCPG